MFSTVTISTNVLEFPATRRELIQILCSGKRPVRCEYTDINLFTIPGTRVRRGCLSEFLDIRGNLHHRIEHDGDTSVSNRSSISGERTTIKELNLEEVLGLLHRERERTMIEWSRGEIRFRENVRDQSFERVSFELLNGGGVLNFRSEIPWISNVFEDVTQVNLSVL